MEKMLRSHLEVWSNKSDYGRNSYAYGSAISIGENAIRKQITPASSYGKNGYCYGSAISIGSFAIRKIAREVSMESAGVSYDRTTPEGVSLELRIMKRRCRRTII